MSNLIISFILALGAGLLVYTKMGKRIGYYNKKILWTTIAVSIVITFFIIFITISAFFTKK